MHALGIIGVAPWATIDFLNCFYGKLQVEKDWEYPRLIIDLDTQIPSRGRYFDLNEENPSAAISLAIRSVFDQGANTCAVVCNTAHILFDEWGSGFDGRLINLIGEVGAKVDQLKITKFSVIGSSYLNKFRTYSNYTETELVPLSKGEQTIVSKMINKIKIGETLDELLLSTFFTTCRRLADDGVEVAVIGCTELSVLKAYEARLPLRLIDSNDVLADCLISRALNY